MNPVDPWLSGLWALGALFVPFMIISFILLRKGRYNSRRSKRVTEFQMTGSIESDPLGFLAGGEPLGGIYLMPEGRVLPFSCEEPELSASPAEEDLMRLNDWWVSQEAIRFLVYALERDDWKREFSEWESTLEETLRVAKQAIERNKLRKSFRLIQGGLEDKEAEVSVDKPETRGEET